jgi:hypothetical protein
VVSSFTVESYWARKSSESGSDGRVGGIGSVIGTSSSLHLETVVTGNTRSTSASDSGGEETDSASLLESTSSSLRAFVTDSTVTKGSSGLSLGSELRDWGDYIR